MMNLRSSTVLGIDPGTTESAWAIVTTINGKPVIENCDTVPNQELLRDLLRAKTGGVEVVIEGLQTYGMAVGQTTFTTAYWVGIFSYVTYGHVIHRKPVVLQLCGVPQAKDKNVRRRLLDIYGDKPTQARPNPAYGKDQVRPKAHEWSAIAIATAWLMMDNNERAHWNPIASE